MKKRLTISLSLLVLWSSTVTISSAADLCTKKSGDINADGIVDLSDAVTILGYLFLSNPTSLPPLCATPAASSGLTATGQAACSHFDTNQGMWVGIPCDEAFCVGQDGSYAKGCPMEGRFVDNNADGTVTDTCTGLMWQKDTADVSDDGQIEPLGDSLAWCDALSYCESLSFAGYNDWRLPNIRELQSIVDYGRVNPAIDPALTVLFQFYWSSTSNVDTADFAWGIGFHVGYVGIRPKAGDPEFAFNYVRAVRNWP